MASEAFLSIGTVTQGKTAKAIFTYLDLYYDAFMQYTKQGQTLQSDLAPKIMMNAYSSVLLNMEI